MVNALSKNKKHGTQYRTLPNSWLFLSRTSAIKEYAFMKSLYDVGYPTPRPIGQNRHVVAMGLVRGVPLYQLHSNRVSAVQAESIFRQSAELAGRLAMHGLVHCDLNEFNLMVDLSGVQARIARVGDNELLDGTTSVRDWEDDATEHYVRHSGLPDKCKGALSAHGPIQKHHIDGTGEVVTDEPPEPLERMENGEPKPIVTLIDFPQMVSTKHPNAKELYERDVVCLKTFFGKKLRCFVEGEEEQFGGIMPSWEELIADEENIHFSEGDGADDATLVSKAQRRLDQELMASGYSEEDAARNSELAYFEAHQNLSRSLDRVEDQDEDGSEEEDECSEEESVDEVDEPVEEPAENECYDFGSAENEDETPELVDMGNFDLRSNTIRRGDGASYAGGVSISGMSTLSYAEAELRARERVKRQLEENKRKAGKKGAFKSRNKNKTYVKGKRVMNDTIDY